MPETKSVTREELVQLATLRERAASSGRMLQDFVEGLLAKYEVSQGGGIEFATGVIRPPAPPVLAAVSDAPSPRTEQAG